ncbi:hypothetical protein DYGSA30_30650 [Dyella sp. GSA-30]|nr:hypothetical protein DYGSA30_30650 [Dyella sp. GSA-30]
MVRVQRNIGGSSLKHSKQSDHHSLAALHAYGYAIVGSDIQLQETMGQAVSLAVQRVEAYVLAVAYQRNSPRRSLNLLLEHFVK